MTINVKKNGQSAALPRTLSKTTATPKDGLGLQHAFLGRIAYAGTHCYKHPVPVTIKSRSHRNRFIPDIFAALSLTPRALGAPVAL